MNRKIKVTAVSYLNAKPLLYGIQHHSVREKLELHLAYPSLVAKQLVEDQTDIGLVSTAALLEIPNGKIISQYGIAASGPVASVCIYAQKPLDQISTIYLDYQSRTSVKLAEILIKKHWKLNIKFKPAPEHFIDLIKDDVAAVIIGDRALEANLHYPYIYDLAEHWKIHTGYDFIFAAWIANKEIPKDFIADFEAANAYGLQHIPEVLKELNYPHCDLNEYFTQHIKYTFDENKIAGLNLFLEELKSLQ